MNSKPVVVTMRDTRIRALLNPSRAGKLGDDEPHGNARAALHSHESPRECGTHPEYPLERICSHLYEPFQLTFARHAQRVLKEVDEVEAEATHRGLLLRGETEATFESPLSLLREYFGNQIDVGPTTIRYHNGAMVEEPYMGLCVRCSLEYFEVIKADLNAREVVGVDSKVGPIGAVLRATAPAAKLLGYASDLAELTSGTAYQEMWLSHYAPVETPPPDDTAA